MKIVIRIQSIHKSHWDTPKVFTVESDDMLAVRAILGDALKPNVEWLNSLCDAIPFSQGHDTFLVPPNRMDLMNTTYRGTMVSVERVAK